MNVKIKDDLLAEWEYARRIAAKLYFHWMKGHSLFEILATPETIQGLFFKKNWVSHPLPQVEEIFEFLTSFKILNEAGGTYVLSEMAEKIIDGIEVDELIHRQGDPTSSFIKHGLKIIDLTLEGDTGHWDMVQQKYLFERGITNKALQIFCYIVKDYINSNSIISSNDNNRSKTSIMYYSPFIICPFTELLNSFNGKGEIKIFVPSEAHQKQFIAFCELNRLTSRFSKNVLIDTEYYEMRKFDVVFIPMVLGFFGSIKDQMKFISLHTKSDSYQFWYTPVTPASQMGTEIMFKMHPDFDEKYSRDNYRRMMISNGFSVVAEIGIEGSILVTQRV